MNNLVLTFQCTCCNKLFARKKSECTVMPLKITTTCPNCTGTVVLPIEEYHRQNKVLEEKNMNKGKVRIAFNITNNGYWSCEQVKTKILEYVSDKDAEINVVNELFDNDFFVDILANRSWADRLNFAEFMEWCEFNIVGSRPLVHGFHSESSEDGYKITFETTSAEEYHLIQSFIREKIISKEVISNVVDHKED